VLMNPPYAEAGSTETISGGEHKTDVATTQMAASMPDYVYATRELFAQYIARISREIPSATLAMFSKLKYVNEPNFEQFRQEWNATYRGGFIVHSKAFDGLKGNFPIGFLIWKIDQNSSTRTPITEIAVEVLNKDALPIGEKRFYNIPNHRFLSEWFARPRSNKEDALPLKNAVTPASVTKDLRGAKWADGAIGSMFSNSNMLQNASTLTALFSSGFGSAGAFFVTAENLWQTAVVFSARRLIKPTWHNNRDQFLQPDKPLTEEFKNDCLVWMLFNGSNLTASANDLEWNGKKWSIVNHFIPYTEEDVGAPGRFESDFMVQYMRDKKFSTEAHAVLQAGKALWKAYFADTDVHTVRDELKLNRADVGWYQIRKALQARNASGDFTPVSFGAFESEYKALTEKLQPMVYELGFLKV
jgi:hypothetical protein